MRAFVEFCGNQASSAGEDLRRDGACGEFPWTAPHDQTPVQRTSPAVAGAA
jgi:hypothetical protein